MTLINYSVLFGVVVGGLLAVIGFPITTWQWWAIILPVAVGFGFKPAK